MNAALLGAGLALVTLSAAANPAPPAPALVGVAKVDITPAMPVRMYGYSARKTESEGVAGRLHAAALALGGDAEPGPAVLLCVDFGSVPAAVCDEVYQRVSLKHKIPRERLVLANAHIHSGPDLKHADPPDPAERAHLAQYRQFLVERLTQVLFDALAARRPAELSWAQGRVAFAANRRVLKDGRWFRFGAVPEGAVDHTLAVLRVSDPGGKPRAVWVNYACHNTTLRGNFRQIHGDWAACAQEAIEKDWPGALALVSLGCGADADPSPHGTVELCAQHGRALADEVARMLKGTWTPLTLPVTARAVSVKIPTAASPTDAELAAAGEKSYSLKRLSLRRAAGEKLPTEYDYPLTTWTFGNRLAMVFLSHEVVVDYALRLKRELDASRLWVSAYCNDVSFYVVSDRLIREGGYEVNNSLTNLTTYGRPEQLVPSMENRIVAAVCALLQPTFSRPAKSGTQ